MKLFNHLPDNRDRDSTWLLFSSILGSSCSVGVYRRRIGVSMTGIQFKDNADDIVYSDQYNSSNRNNNLIKKIDRYIDVQREDF